MFSCYLLFIFVNYYQLLITHAQQNNRNDIPQPPRINLGRNIGGSANFDQGDVVIMASRTLDGSPLANIMKTFPLIRSATAPHPQENVASEAKQHAVFITITLSALTKECVQPARNIQKWLDNMYTPQYSKKKDNEVVAGVGFAPEVYMQFGQNNAGPFVFQARTGPLGTMPHTAGHIFVHAKSDSRGNLRYLAAKAKAAFLPGCIKSFKDVYSFKYRDSRDLTGFIDGTENVVRNQRMQVAVNPKTGGSFCLTQRWFHDFDVIKAQRVETLEGWVGRTLNYSRELPNKPATSHVARMTSGPAMNAVKPFQIYRQSMPFGVVGGDSGLYFIAYANSTDNFDYMLNRMVGATADGLSDNIMRLSKAISGKYWYFPSKEELKTFAE